MGTEAWPLWEVFIRANRGLSHVHVGSLHAPDAEMAVRANLKDAGLLVERAHVQRGTFDVVRAFRDSVMVIGQRAAPRCIGLADSREIEHVIVEETRKALEGFEARMAALLPPKEAGT